MKDSCEVIEERGMLSGLGVGDGTKPASSNQYGEKHTQELSVGYSVVLQKSPSLTHMNAKISSFSSKKE